MEESCIGDLSIVIVYYSGLSALSRCLDSIKPFESEVETIIIDNSPASEGREVAERYRVIYHTKLENLGFARAANWGTKLASRTHILFLNPDTVVSREPLEAACQHLASKPEVALVCVSLNNESGPDPAQVASFPKLFRRIKPMQVTIAGRGVAGNFALVSGWVKGAFMLFRRADFEKLHGFDERFFVYGEDMELCFRIHKYLRGDIHLLLDQQIYHEGHPEWQEQRLEMVYGAVLVFIRKHYGALQNLLARMNLGCLLLWRWSRASLAGKASKPYLKLFRVVIASHKNEGETDENAASREN